MKAKCINSDCSNGSLKFGEIYEVESVENNPTWLWVNVNRKSIPLFAERFEIIKTLTTEEAAVRIYNALEKQRFSDWYRGDYESHLMGDKNCKTKEQIIEDIKKLFCLY